MISLKPGVTLLGLVPQMLLALRVMEELYSRRGTELVITAGNDGKHKRASEHYGGRALDLRTSNLGDPAIAGSIVTSAQQALGPDFFVLLEVDHIHIHFEPKGPSL